MILDFDTPDGGTIKFSNNYNKTKRDFVDYTRNYPTDGSFVYYGANPQIQDINVFQSSLTGQNHLLGFDLTWALSFAQSEAETPYDYLLRFAEPSSTDAEGNILSGMENIPPEVRSRGPVSDLIPLGKNNFSSAYANGGYYNEQRNLDREKTAYLNMSRDYTFGKNLTGTFKFGGKYRWKNRFRNLFRAVSVYYLVAFPQYTRAADGSIVPKDFSGTLFENYDLTEDRTFSTYFINDDLTAEDRKHI